jgi:hypothetical protein
MGACRKTIIRIIAENKMTLPEKESKRTLGEGRDHEALLVGEL